MRERAANIATAMAIAVGKALALALASFASPALGAPWDPVPGDAHLIAGGSYEHFPEETGRTLSIDRVDRYGSKVLTIGAQVSQVADSQWGLLRAGGANSTKRGLMVSGGFDLGPGKIGEEHFVYKRLRVDVSMPLTKRWSFLFGDSYVDITPITGHLLGVGVSYADPRGVAVQARAFGSVSGNVDERRLMLRVDYRAKPPFLSAGLVGGDTNNSLALNLPGRVESQRQLQGFVGIAFPVGKYEVGLLCDVVELDVLRRESLSFTVRIPVKRRE